MNKYISTFCLCATLLIFSCTDPNLIGLEVQPPFDGIKVALTTTDNNLTIHTISEDSLRSDETSTLLLGEINDPIFGYNQAAFSTQFMLPFSNVDVGSYSDSLTVDSIVLGLSYTGSYGINDVLNIMVYEISESIYKDSVYYSNQDVTCVSNAIYSQTITVNTEDSVMVGGEMKVPQLRLKLDISLGDKILIESGRSNLEDNAQFVEFFKGLYVSASNDNDGVIAYLSPISANSKLSIYYHSTNVDSLSLDFSLTGDATRINLFEKDTSYLFNQADTSTNTYVQSMAGHKTVIEIQHLDTLKTFFKDKAINRVNLSFELDGTDTADFPPHGRMYLVRVDNEGKDYFLTDYIVEGEDHFGGKLENGKYTFNITRYFLQLLNNEDYTNKLYLVAAGGAVNANRTILPKDKISFNIIYTDL
ncbi:MAG: DUF4270 domain-containing protein [Flavobacteriales bacterium]|jgi:hypothetical protein|nr:DUF4270 domain-containing protein [Flavobacteriales bacterium]|tara:strand:- start:1808 stop:3061 length:1254 start_codon:yes stop_codon:yes gene_type:complete